MAQLDEAAQCLPSCRSGFACTAARASPHAIARTVRKACDLGEGESCLALASMYERGEGVERDRAKSEALAAKGRSLPAPAQP